MEPPPRTESLVHAYRSGAERAFGELYDRLAPTLYAWAALRAPRGVDPSDLTGEIWLQAIGALDRFEDERASFRAWIFGVAKHVLLHELRRQERFRAGVLEPDRPGAEHAAVESIPDSITSVSRRLERDEAVLRFLDRVRALGRDERELVVYCGLEGFTCAQAAPRLGLSEAATIKRWQRLRAELRDSLWAEELLA